MNDENSADLVEVFGLITDIQYADCENGTSADKLRVRNYRNSVNLVRNAVEHWQKEEHKLNRKFKFIIQLGDLIDGKAKLKNESLKSMNLVLNELKKLFSNVDPNEKNSPKLLHIWGNHEMYNFNRNELINLELNSAHALRQNLTDNANYYGLDVSDNLRLLCLDYYQFSMLGNEQNEQVYSQVLQLLRKYNQNENLNSEVGLDEANMRYVQLNGGLHENQLKWLKDDLVKCVESKKKAIVCGHIPLLSNASNKICIAYNSEVVLNLLWSFQNTVVAYFAGHFHPGNYFLDEKNIHHITFRAVVETRPDSNSFATVKVFKNYVLVQSYEEKLTQYKIFI